jgi:hypothetical protein
LKGNPTFLGLTFALPAFAFYLNPSLSKLGKLSYWLCNLFLFITIGLTDLFTLCILVPPFLIIGIVLTKKKYKLYNLLGY